MKGLLVCSLVLATFAASSFAVRPELDENWESFKATYEKAYEDEDDEALRRDIWEANFDFIQQHNEEYEQGLHTYSVGENEFADMTHEEFLLILLPAVWPAMEPASEASVHQGKADLKDLPDSVDWREKNVVTPVKDQKQCGSCWAFSATGSLEAMHAIATGNLVSLSEQNLVDCSQEEGNMGCSGGFPDWAFEYIIKNNGIDTEDSYPYLAVDGDCKFNPANVGATLKNYTMIQKGSDADLQQVLAEKGPVSCGMDASHFSFQLYKSGVYNEKACSKTMLDHGVLCVGYGDDRGQKYWIVKNSWGTSWGEEGYFQLNRDEPNMCGITTRSSFPIV